MCSVNYAALKKQFISRYGSSEQDIKIYFAPGRVNLIGDHTDYSGGLVFPCAIDKGNALLIRQSNDDAIKLASTNFDMIATLAESEADKKHGDHWINYPLGVFQQFSLAGHKAMGFECLYSGNVPSAAGLSSSAAIEVVTAFAINDLLNSEFSLLELVKMAQRAENEFVGVQCGIMDQFAVAMAQSEKAMQLNCQTLECDQIPLQLGEYKLVLANSNQRRELSESKYNQRVNETQQALSIFKSVIAIDHLAQVTPEQLLIHAHLFSPNDVIYQRAMHVVSEHNRVVTAVAALRSGDLQQFGTLMNQSHASLRDDYGVSSDPLNTLVELATQSEGVLGARLTGAGFGGCTVNIVHSEQVNQFINDVGENYQQRTGLTAHFYPVSPADGVRGIQL